MFAGKTGDSPGRDGTIGRVGGRRVETGETEDGSENVDYFRVTTTLLLTGPRPTQPFYASRERRKRLTNVNQCRCTYPPSCRLLSFDVWSMTWINAESSQQPNTAITALDDGENFFPNISSLLQMPAAVDLNRISRPSIGSPNAVVWQHLLASHTRLA